MDTWEAIETDRVAFAEYLASPQDWDAPTWCDGWTVKEVAAHLLVAPTMTKGQVFLAFVKSGFNLDRMSAKLVGQMTDEEIVAKTGDTAGVRSAPPGLKPLGVFGELLAHSINISLALGKPFGVAVGHYVTGLNNMKDVQPVLGCKKGIAGLKLRANDADRSTGDGPLVEGDGCCLP